jgi:hypothetical protein
MFRVHEVLDWDITLIDQNTPAGKMKNPGARSFA